MQPPARTITIVAMLITVGGLIYIRQWIFTTYWFSSVFGGGEAALAFQQVMLQAPLFFCVVALLFLAIPVHARHAGGSAQLAPRNLLTFASRPWLVTVAAITAVIVLISILAGLASRPDEQGRHVLYNLSRTGNDAASTSIYGWWFSVPGLVLIAAIIVIALFDLAVISRPSFGTDSEGDAAIRRARSRNVLAVTAGGLILYLGAIMSSLAGTWINKYLTEVANAGVDVSFDVAVTTFAAMARGFEVAGYLAVVIGFAIWWGVLLSVAFTRAQRTGVPIP
jgi:hypothetical protein